MLNYAGCHECQSKSFVDEAEKSREEEEDGNEECITYKRMYTTPPISAICTAMAIHSGCCDGSIYCRCV